MTYTVHPAAELLPPIIGEEWDRFVEDIRENGQIVPIIVKGTVVIDGRHRLRACEQLERLPVTVPWDGPDDEAAIIARIVSLNDRRRHMSHAQRADVAEGLATLPRGGDGSNQYRRREQNLHQQDLHPRAVTQVEAAKLMDVSRASVENMSVIKKRGSESLIAAAREERIGLREAADITRVAPDKAEQDRMVQLPRPERLRAIQDARIGPILKPKKPPKRPVAPPPVTEPEVAPDDATYRIIVAAPPDAMSNDDLRALAPTVRDRAAPDGCVLFLWTTNQRMRDAFRVLDAWGFSERTIVTWVQDRWSVADWFGKQTEHCIVATSNLAGVPKWWAPELPSPTTSLGGRVAQGARPDAFYDAIDKAHRGPKLQLFEGTARHGWPVLASKQHVGGVPHE